MADNAYIKIATALLKHQIKKLVGDEAFEIIGDEMTNLGGEKLEALLSDKTIREGLEKAAGIAQDNFRGKVSDFELEQWMHDLPLENLPKVIEAITKLPKASDERGLENALRESISLNWRKLTPTQVDLAVNTFMKCLRDALLPLEKQTLMVIGRSVLRTEEKIDLLVQLTEQIRSQTAGYIVLDSPQNPENKSSNPESRSERLFSNLLQIERYAKSVFVAKTRARGRNQIYQKLHEMGIIPGNEFILREKSIISFHRLTEYPWTEVCDSNTALEYSSSEWALSQNLDKKNEFIDLLNKSLETKLYPDILFDRVEKYYYFTPTTNLTDKELSYSSIKKNTSRFVFKGYFKKTDEKIGYFRHSAFFGKFLRFDDRWFLEITPHYQFTTNGYKLSRYSDKQLSKIKRMELNPAVLGQVIMWAEYLGKPPDLFSKEYSFLSFGNLVSFDFNFGLDDESWLSHEDADNQMAGIVKSEINELPLFKDSEF